MLHLFDDVKGCDLTISKFHSTISFTTTSDALVSSLFIKYASTMSLQLIDDILALFRQADFRNREVTMRKGEDIMDHIAAQRRLVVADREQKQYRDQGIVESDVAKHSQTWTVVPRLLAEYAGSRRIPLHRIDESRHAFYYYLTRCEMTELLQTMALVHRSWTEPAQRELRRRVQFLDQKQLRIFLQSPLIGPWVREVAFRGLMSDMNSISAEEASQLMSGILERCPDLTYLRLDGFRFEKADTIPEAQEVQLRGVLSQILNLKHLEHLSFRQGHVRAAHNLRLKDLCALLPALHSLKSLSVESTKYWKPDHSDLDPEPTNTLNFTNSTSLPATLEALSLVNVNFFCSGLLSWFVNSQRRNRITKLELSCLDLFYRGDSQIKRGMEDLRRLFEPGLVHLSKLQLIECEDFNDIESFVRFFPYLQSLSLGMGNSPSFPDGPFELPKSVQEFHFHYQKHEPSDSQDLLIRRLLEAHPGIRRINITYHKSEEPISTMFKESLEYCSRNDVEFTATKTNNHWQPHFLDF